MIIGSMPTVTVLWFCRPSRSRVRTPVGPVYVARSWAEIRPAAVDGLTMGMTTPMSERVVAPPGYQATEPRASAVWSLTATVAPIPKTAGVGRDPKGTTAAGTVTGTTTLEPGSRVGTTACP